MEVGGRGGAAEVHGRSDLVSGKGSAATGIWHEWREKGRVGGGENRQRRVGVRQGTSVCWDRYS